MSFKSWSLCHFNNSVELCSSFGGYVAKTKLGTLHDGALCLNLECYRHSICHWSEGFFFIYNLDLLLFDIPVSVGYTADHFIIHSLNNIIVYYDSYMVI